MTGPASRGPAQGRRASMAGVTLVELMVALLLGLLVAGAAMSVFIANKKTYVAAENLGRLQESSRVAFELMARDIRELGVNACGSDLSQAANVLNTPTAAWYTDFANGIRGYDGATAFADAGFGTAEGDRVAGTDALQLLSVDATSATIQAHVPASARFGLNTVDHGLEIGDIAVACDPQHAAIFQVTNAQPGTNANIVHQTGTGTPGNCSSGLGSPVSCTPPGTAYRFGCAFGGTVAGIDCALEENRWSAFIASLRALRWYVGCNGRAACDVPAGRSLYRSRLANDGGTLAVHDDEIAEGVTGMSLRYLVTGGTGYVTASAVTDWGDVVAVAVALDLESNDLVDGQRLERTLEHVVALRGRAP